MLVRPMPKVSNHLRTPLDILFVAVGMFVPSKVMQQSHCVQKLDELDCWSASKPIDACAVM